VWEDYGCHVMPGWQHGTVGYHVDDGTIFDARNETTGKEIEDAMAYRGDLIGCTVKFDLATEGKVRVVFSLNGKQITQEEISIHNPNKKPLYPYIGMAHKGIRVLAKMNCSEGTNRVTACTFEATGQEGREKIKMAVEELDKLAETFQDNVTNVKKEIFDVRLELDIAGRELSLLKSQICAHLNLIGPSSLSVPVMDSSITNSATSSNFQRQNCGEEELLNWHLRAKFNEKVHRLGNITSEGFDSLFDMLRVVKEDGERHTLTLKELRKEVEKSTDAQRHLRAVDVISTHGYSDPVISMSDNSCSTFKTDVDV